MSIQPILLNENGKEVLFSTSREAAKYLGVTPSCICYYLKTGKLTRFQSDYDILLLEMEKTLGKKLNHNLKSVLSKMTKYIADVEKIKENFLLYAEKKPNERSKRIIDNFKLVYGDVVGKEKYNQWLQKQKESNLGTNKPLEWFRKKSIWSLDYWLSRGYTEKQAVEKITEYQSKNAKNANKNRKPNSRTTNIAYWTNKGFSEKEAKQKLRERQSTRKNLLEIKDPLLEYYREVWYHTNSNKHLINGIENRSQDLHIDHIFSIRDGFDFSVPAEIIGSPINLRMLAAKENIKKYSKSDISLEQLYDSYERMVGGKGSNSGGGQGSS